MTYRSEVLADSPTHYWPMSEPGGTIVSDIMDPAGAASAVSASVGYRGVTSSDGAALINAVNNNAYIGLKSKAYCVVPFSLEVWVWIWGALGTYQEALMFGDTSKDVEVTITTALKVNITLRGGTGSVTSVASLSVNTWHHIVCNVSGVTGYIYIDGTLDTSAAVTPNLPGSDPFAIGGFTDRTQPLNGYVGSPAIYAAMLSIPRILAHYNAAEQKAMAPIFGGSSSAQQVNNVQAELDAQLATLAVDLSTITNLLKTTYQNAP